MRRLTDTLLEKPFNTTLTRVSKWWRHECHRSPVSDEALRKQNRHCKNVLPSIKVGYERYDRVSEDAVPNALHELVIAYTTYRPQT